MDSIRIIQLPNKNAAGVDDYIAVDSTANGTKKIQFPNLLDDGLTIQNKAADAKATGDAINGAIGNEASTRQSADANLQTQIDQLIAPSGEAPSAAEIENARIGAPPENTVYPTLGNAIRGQVTDLKAEIGDYNYYSPYLSSSQTGVGKYWNTVISKSISNGEEFKFKLLSYSGELFTSCAIGYVTASNEYINIQGSMLIGTEYLITAPTNIDRLYVQIVRSANEYDVSASFVLDFIESTKGLNGKVSRNSENISNLEKIISVDNLVSFSSVTQSTTYRVYGDFKAGDTFKVDVDFTATGDGQKNIQVGRAGNYLIFYDSGSGVYTVAENATYINVYIAIVGTVSITGSARIYTGLQFDVEELQNKTRIFTCLKDGTGDFNNLATAINTVCELMDATLYVGPGTWNLITELGSEYINSVGSSKRGLYLKNRVHVICSSEALITCNYTGTRADTIQWLSAFNAGEHGFTLENARIESSNCRYSVHDERDTQTDYYINKYINCSMKHDNTAGGYAQCIGGGLGKDGYIIIDGCIFENPNATQTGIVSYHNTWYAGGDGRSTVEVKGCYIKGTNTFRCSWFGASQEISTFLVHDNSFGKAPIHVVENQSMMDDNPSWIQNTEMYAWNNEIRA